MTPLQRQLAEPDRQRPQPIDALRLARRTILDGRRLDMQALAAELGVNRVTLYRWVGSRDDLLVEVLWSMTRWRFNEIWAGLSDQPGPAGAGGAAAMDRDHRRVPRHPGVPVRRERTRDAAAHPGLRRIPAPAARADPRADRRRHRRGPGRLPAPGRRIGLRHAADLRVLHLPPGDQWATDRPGQGLPGARRAHAGGRAPRRRRGRVAALDGGTHDSVPRRRGPADWPGGSR